MVYQQCGQLCPQTCDIDEDEECSGGCVEGCFCPSGMFTSYGYCITSSDCQGMHIIVRLHRCLYIIHMHILLLYSKVCNYLPNQTH